MVDKLFVYGTLRFSHIQQQILGRTIEGQADMLPDFMKSKIKIDKKNYPIAVYYPGRYIKGLVLSIEDNELSLLDKYETNAYRREQVNLKSGQTTWAYIK